MSRFLAELGCIVGFGLIGCGLWMIWIPLFWIYAGAVMLAIATSIKQQGNDDRSRLGD